MKNKKILSAAAVMLFVLFGSCKKEGSTGTGTEIATGIKFASSINGQIKTKAVNDVWETNDAIGVFMKTGNGFSNVLAANKKYNTAGDGQFAASSSDQTLYYPENGSNVDFIAYYPFRQNLANTIYSVDVNNQSNQSAIDLLYANNATGLNKTSTAANLNFIHQLAKIEFTIKAGAGITDLTGLSATIAGLNTKANFDLATGTLGTQTEVGDIVAKTGTVNNALISEAIVLPVEDASGKVVTFRLTTGIFKLTLPTGTKFEQGKKYTYAIELKNDGTATPQAVALTATITDWNNVPSGSYTVGQDDEVNPPAGEDKVLVTETFGTGTISSTARPKIATYSNFDNKTLSFTDSYGTADLRTISTYGEGTNAHVWLPANKDASLMIAGIAVSGYTKLKIKFDAAANITGTNTGNLNIMKVKVNGVEYGVTDQPIVGSTDGNKFYTLEVLGNVPAIAINTVEFYGAASANSLGLRLDNIIITGTNK